MADMFSKEEKALPNVPASFWKRVSDVLENFAEAFDYREADYLSERLARLEKEVSLLRSKPSSAPSSDA